MTLRSALGERVQGVYEQVDELLDSDAALIVLFNGRRMVSYTHGFVASPCQLELVGVEVERSVRSAVGVSSTGIRARSRRAAGETRRA